MSTTSPDVVEALRVALKERDRLRKENARLLAGATEPVAIVGMACRYPGGVSTPRELWDLVADGRDAISGFPADRGWDLERLYDPDPESPGTSYTRAGGFIAGAADFDPVFFGIAPREVAGGDPQSRLMLEASWEAFESAGIVPSSVRGSQTGVFAGAMYHDYAWGRGSTAADQDGPLPTAATGSVLSGRIAYLFGLEGPTVSLDTACSSSLVATHLATQALLGGECSLALAGGVTVLSTPRSLIEFSRQRGLAPDGRCKSFAEAADGVGFAEGAGVLVLERLSDAERNGHPIFATIRGSAVNQDGASNGPGAPNGPSQERVIRQALANARLRPEDIDAVEAHGTGTTLGDPIEAGALLATYGQDREQPLRLGSIKSNIGHTQAASGAAGVIKTVMAMREGVLPKTLHVDAPSSKVDWEAGQIELLTEAVQWKPNGRPRRAGVSSFGASGTNAHLILEEAPEPAEVEQGGEPKPTPLGKSLPFVLSAKAELALRESASRLTTRIEADPELELADLAHSLTTTRSTFEDRAVVVAEDREQLLSGLSHLAAGSSASNLLRASAKADQRPVFLFPGQGSQWLGMGVELSQSSAPFAKALDACEEALEPFVDWSLREVLGEDQGAWLDRLDIVQPALFALMVSLARLWQACGIEPSVVAGHSQGEIAAAHVAGALSLQDASRVIALRAKAMTKIAGKGAMASVSVPEAEVERLLSPYGERISLAALNGPASLVLSGETEAIEALIGQCDKEEIRAQRIAVDYAAHSAQIEALEPELLEAFAPISPQSSEIPLHSTLTGERIDTKELDAKYWYRNLREPVRLEPVIRSLLEQGQRTLIEIGPHPVLGFAVQETIDDALGAEGKATVLGSLRRDEGAQRFALSLAQAHVAGAKPEWSTFFEGTGAKAIPLPTYPFQRKRYWLEAGGGGSDPGMVGLVDAEHPLLRGSVEDPEADRITLTGRVSLNTHRWLADHAPGGELPGAAFLELALVAAREIGGSSVERLTVEAPLVVPAELGVQLQVRVAEPGDRGERAFSIHSRPERGEEMEWTCHGRGTISTAAAVAPAALPAWPPADAEPIDVDAAYDRLADLGFDFGPGFQGLAAAWKSDGEIFAEVAVAPEQEREAGRFLIHPALLDGVLHGAFAGSTGEDGEGPEHGVPSAWADVSLHAGGAAKLRARIGPGDDGHLTLALADQEGTPVAAIGALKLEALAADPSTAKRGAQNLLEVKWIAASPTKASVSNDSSLQLLRLEELDFERGPDRAEAARGAAIAALSQLQEWLADSPPTARLAFLTSSAVAARPGEQPDLASATVWGLLRSAQAEHPGRIALVDSDESERSVEMLQAALANDETEPQLALRDGELFAPRLVRLEEGDGDGPSASPDYAERTILISGGTGRVGAHLARHLASEHGARHLLLLSREGAAGEGAERLTTELEQLGASVRVEACDVADRDRLQGLLESIDADRPLGAVVHAAAVADDGLIEAMGAEKLAHAFGPRVDGAWHLHELTRDLDLSAFVTFTAAVRTLGGLGQANNVAADAFLEALAKHRQGEGLPATALAWGLWDRDSGVSSHLGEVERKRIEGAGLVPMSGERGLALLDAALASGHSSAMAADFDRAALRAAAEVDALPPVMRKLAPGQRRRRTNQGGLLGDRLAKLPAADRESVVLDLVRTEAAVVLGHASVAEVDPERAFRDLGLESAGAVELRNRLVDVTGMRLAATLVFDHPSPRQLAKYLLELAAGDEKAPRAVVRAQSSEEPIAIVGMSCRLPGGVGSPRDLWRFLARGGDAIGEFPADRGWDLERLFHPDPDNPGTSYSREGGFLADPGDFDPGFFGISPREAQVIDPQQRLLLEASWEALERAGVDPFALRGSPTGIFTGISALDYSAGLMSSGDDEHEGYRLTGAAGSVVSGRVAYTLGFEGPAITVDTACSASLVAIHLASQALRAGECSMALAGGVAVLCTTTAFSEFSRQRGLAPDGRCKAFAESADGTGWSEGVGVLALERLSEAEANGHRVLATIRGSAVNQDGASNGLTAPSGPSQERVIRQALANARLEPKDVDAVEAHGTGTTLGDPIEAGALLATYGQEREAPLKLGSIKSNIGHAQAAAGVSGVIKMVMAMQEGVLPKTLHVDAPSSKVDWEAGQIELLTESAEWKPNGHPRRAGVSSFGMSGTNAHVILEEGPRRTVEEKGGESLPGPVPLIFSAKSPQALRDSASRLAAHLEDNPELDLTDLSFSLVTTRAAMEERAAVVGEDRDQLLTALEALATGKPSPDTHTATALSGRLAYLFTGQGSQRAGMGKGLYETYPTYREALNETCEEIDKHLGCSLKELLFSEPGSKEAKLLDDTTYAQPALFATEVALFRLLGSFGLKPDLLTGHSVGEIVAAHIAGALDLKDAAKLICARGRLMGALPSGGAMLAIEATEQEAKESIAGKEELLSIAAINGPTATVVSGDAKAIEALDAQWQAKERKTKRLSVSHAFHSPLIEPMLEDFAKAIAQIAFQEPKLPIVSNTTGELLTKEQATDPAYWVSHVREPVRFADAVATLKDQGTTTYLELGPEAVLTAMAASCLSEDDKAQLIPTLREGRDEVHSLSLAFASSVAAGAKPDWSALFKGTGAKAIPLPTYPFQRKRYWLSSTAASGDLGAAGLTEAEHPFLVARVEDPQGEGIVLTGRISLQTHPWLADHAVAGTVLLPGTAFVELALKAGQEVGCELVEELALQAPLLLPQSGGVAIQVKVGAPGEDAKREVSIHSRAETGQEDEPSEWACHAQGVLSAEQPEAAEPLGAWPPEGAEPIELDSVYERIAEVGFDYGPAFQGLSAAWELGEEVYAEISLAEEQVGEAGRFGVHPALFDATLHGAFLLSLGAEAMEKAGGPLLPFAWTGVRLDARGATSLRVRLGIGEESFALGAFDRDGAPALSVGSVIARPISPGQLGGGRPTQKGLMGLGWARVPSPSASEEVAAEIVSLSELGVERHSDLAKAAHQSGRVALELVKNRLAGEEPEGSPLALLTEGAVAASPGEDADPAAAVAWGLMRSAQSEQPGRFVLIDTDGSEASRQALPTAIAASADEPQLALREGELLAPRIAQAPERGGMLAPPPGLWRLAATQSGTLEGLSLVPAPHLSEPPGPGMVRIAMRAAGLNFRDVMAVLGVYPGGAEIGGEGAGVVTEVGPEVEGLAVGDRVMGLAAGAFGSFAIADWRTLVPVPEGWSFERAAAVPIAVSTAYYGLRELAGLKPGEKILVHAGAGGVGSAAVALARHWGAEVFATASPAKWEALREAGVADDHIASSRDLDFKQRFLELTDGKGVDMVLNALAGEFVEASLELMPRGGRFLEMGKTDIRDPERVAADHPGVVYRAIDLGDAGPRRVGEILAEVVALLDEEELLPAAPVSWDVRRAPEAFRHLREGKNVGKVVLEIPRPIDPERTVLITGATGGLGALLARHLVEEHGARRLLLASRGGPEASGATDLLAELRELGAEVRIESCDVSDREQLRGLIESIDAEHPLGAVIHAAGVIEDGVVESMGAEQLDRVLAPKVDGAWHLHELTEGLDLQAFVMFSSMAATLGGPGQGNYAAANHFLDALAAHRQAEGLAATSIAWGLWQRESGMTSGLDEADLARMKRFGAEALTDEHGLELFDAALREGGPLVLAVPLDRAAFGRLASAGILPPILRGLVRRRTEQGSASAIPLAERLAKIPAAEHEAAVLELVREEVAAVLGHASAKEIPPERPFIELGFDSLAAVELRNRLATTTAAKLPATLIFDYPTSVAIAAYLLAEVNPSEGASATAEIERLEDALAAIPAGDAQRSGLAAHLRSLAADLESDGKEKSRTSKAERLEAASDEELLEFIDEQVGPVEPR